MGRTDTVFSRITFRIPKAGYRAVCLVLVLCTVLALGLTGSDRWWAFAPVHKREAAQLRALPGEPYFIPEVPLAREVQQYIWRACKKNKVDYELVLAVIWNESRFQADAVHKNRNGSTDSGLMQINDVNSEWIAQAHNVTDLMDTRQNIRAGVAIIGDMVAEYGQHDGLMAYNLGERGMRETKAAGRETTLSVQRVLARRIVYENMKKIH